MFLQPFYPWKLPVTSNASRNNWRLLHKWKNQSVIRALSCFRPWTAGRNNSGRIILWTRGSLRRKRRIVKINYSLRYNRLGFIASFQLIPSRNKLITLVYFANGAITYFLTTENHKIFTFQYLNFTYRLRKFALKSTLFMLCNIKKLSFVNVVEILPGTPAQYVRSNGTRAKIMKFEKQNYSVLLQLPSGVRKIFSYFSFANLGAISLAETKKLYIRKAGHWRNFGWKSCVRGVAMNPVDHPHGGRTKSIKYPRTPWGNTTKFK